MVGWGSSTAASRKELQKASRAGRALVLLSALLAMLTLGAGSIWYVITDHSPSIGANSTPRTSWVPILGIWSALLYLIIGVAVVAIGHLRSQRTKSSSPNERR
jgi:hypothetical protein